MATESFFSNASLAYLASAGAGKDGKTYSIKPTDGTGDFTFSRGSNLAATRVGADGLIEKGRENLLLQSNQFDTTWVLINNVTLTSGQLGYDGSSDAWKLNTQNAFTGYVRQNISSSGINSFSIYAKADTLTWIRISINGAVNASAYYDIANGVVGSSVSPVDTSIEVVGNNWYRITLVTNDSAITAVRIYGADGDGVLGVGGSIYIQSAQLEIGLAATDVISTGATTGKAGLLEDEPRFDYSGGATCPSLLLEPSRTNIFLYSEYFGAWSIIGSPTITSNYGTSPEGLQNSTRIEGVDGDRIYIGISGSSATYTYSIYAKGSGDIKLRDNSGSYNLNISLSSNWQRYDYSFTASFTNIQIQIDSTTDAEIWGAQLEQGSYPTSYIPNHSGGSVTRGDDEVDLTGASSLIGQTEGTFFLDWEIIDNIGDRYIALLSVDNRILFYRTNAGVRVQITANASTIYQSATLNNIDGRNKLAVSYTSGDIKVYLNGSEAETSTPTFTFSNPLSDFDFQFAGKDNKTRIYQCLTIPEALSGTDLATLTTL